MQALSDHDLMLSVKDGNLDQMGLLFERYHQKLYNLFLWQTRSQHASEDLVQDVFFRMIRSRHTYRGDGKFTTWMFSVARSARADYFRKGKREIGSLDQAAHFPCDDMTPEDELEKKSDHEILYQAMEQLSEDKREVLLLSRFQNLKYEQIADVMSCSVGTIKSRVFWALKDLSKIYKGLCGEDHDM